MKSNLSRVHPRFILALRGACEIAILTTVISVGRGARTPVHIARIFVLGCVVWLWTSPAAFAADGAPPVPQASIAAPEPTAAPQLPPTQAPVPTSAPFDTPEPMPTSAPETSPVVVTQEHPPTPVPPTVAPVLPATSPVPAGTKGPLSPSSPVQGVNGSSPQLTSSTFPGQASTDTGSTGIIDVNSSPGGYAAPGQLKCSTRRYPNSGPFLQAPFAGWASINSFLDHDQPDYSIDGEIVLANGLRASTSGGQGSDVFPSYWSSSLRQYVSYDGHNGYDYGISYQPVLAAADGTVMYAGWNGASESEGYGQMILINHHNGYVTLYGHLSSLEVSRGDVVKAGEEIGISGSTGNSSGPHLHFSVYHDCEVTDPYGWTGKGSDPLTSFDGEHASYLWLPGHDPLVLNPPPNWPAYPLGLKVALPPGVSAKSVGHRSVPAVDRLLLLSLPALAPGEAVTAPLALARTEDVIDQEALTLAPYLQQLESQGLLDAYQVVPAAGAIWVRGTATSQQLEALPGVASLSGVGPGDLRAGQAGLAHSVLIQLGEQQAPSLWPVGFRSALHPWRPIVTAVTGHSLVEGFALPGQDVIVSVQRAGAVPAAAEATGDPASGGFVATLEDASGQPFAIEPGDVVQVRTGGRQAAVRISVLHVDVHAGTVSGTARPGSTVPISIVSRESSSVWHAMATTGSSGRFSVVAPSTLRAGALAVVSVTDGAGDQVSASSHVPGLIVDETGLGVTGWASRARPDLQVWRKGKLIFVQRVHPSPDGVYHLDLPRSTHTAPLLPGDSISVGSRWRRHRLVVAALGARLTAGSRQVLIHGPPGAHLSVVVSHAGHADTRLIALDGAGRYTLRMPSATWVGDSVSVALPTSTGDTLTATSRVRGVVVHLGSATLTGQTVSGGTVTARVFDAHGAIAWGTALADPATGDFSLVLESSAHRQIYLTAGMHLLIQDSMGGLEETVPELRVERTRAINQVGVGADSGTIMLYLVDKNGVRHAERVALGNTGARTVKLRNVSHLHSVVVSVQTSNGISFERTLKIQTRTACAKTTPRRTCSVVSRRKRAR